ncbi:unnamed protein product, partial [Rotaria magnacalcarata]
MAQQVDQCNKNNQEEKSKTLLKFKKPMETLGVDHREMSTFDAENAKKFG